MRRDDEERRRRRRNGAWLLPLCCMGIGFIIALAVGLSGLIVAVQTRNDQAKGYLEPKEAKGLIASIGWPFLDNTIWNQYLVDPYSGKRVSGNFRVPIQSSGNLGGRLVFSLGPNPRHLHYLVDVQSGPDVFATWDADSCLSTYLHMNDTVGSNKPIALAYHPQWGFYMGESDSSISRFDATSGLVTPLGGTLGPSFAVKAGLVFAGDRLFSLRGTSGEHIRLEEWDPITGDHLSSLEYPNQNVTFLGNRFPSWTFENLSTYVNVAITYKADTNELLMVHANIGGHRVLTIVKVDELTQPIEDATPTIYMAETQLAEIVNAIVWFPGE